MICELIAEVSCIHMGDMNLASKLIRSASESGASYVKFQTWKTRNLKSGPWDLDGRSEIYKQAEISEDDHKYLIEVCKNENIKFLTSIYSLEDINFLSSVCREIKIPGPEAKNTELVLNCISNFDRVFISTGATKKEEYETYVKYPNVVLMHCVSLYPCPDESVNLDRLRYISTLTSSYGYSGHYHGIWDAIAAISLGCKFVEKHFTINKDIPHRDAKYAILPNEMKKIADYSLVFNKMSKNHGLDFQEGEAEVRNIYSGRWSK